MLISGHTAVSVVFYSKWTLLLTCTVTCNYSCTTPHTWQKHVLLASQNSKFWQSNFKGYPPTLERFGANPQTLHWKQSQQRVRAFCLLQFWKPCLKFLPSLFVVNAMSCQTANKSAMIICVTGATWQNMFLSRVWTGSCKWRYFIFYNIFVEYVKEKL